MINVWCVRQALMTQGWKLNCTCVTTAWFLKEPFSQQIFFPAGEAQVILVTLLMVRTWQCHSEPPWTLVKMKQLSRTQPSLLLSFTSVLLLMWLVRMSLRLTGLLLWLFVVDHQFVLVVLSVECNFPGGMFKERTQRTTAAWHVEMGTFRFYYCDSECTSLLTLTFSFNLLDIVLLSLSVQVGMFEYILSEVA